MVTTPFILFGTWGGIHKRQWLMDKNHETILPKDGCLFFIPISFEFFLYTGMSGLVLFFQDHDWFGMKDTLVFISECDKNFNLVTKSSHRSTDIPTIVAPIPANPSLSLAKHFIAVVQYVRTQMIAMWPDAGVANEVAS
jgi:hypothetical protein